MAAWTHITRSWANIFLVIFGQHVTPASSVHAGAGTPLTPQLGKGTTPRVRLRGRHTSAANTPAPFAGFAVSSPSPVRPPPEPLVFGSGGNSSKTDASVGGAGVRAAQVGPTGPTSSFPSAPLAGTAVPAFPSVAGAAAGTASASPMPAAAAVSPASAATTAGQGVSPGFSPMAWSPLDGVASSSTAQEGETSARTTPFMVFGARGQGLAGVGAAGAVPVDGLREQLAAMGLAGSAAAHVSHHLSSLFTKLQVAGATGRGDTTAPAPSAGAGGPVPGAATAAQQHQQGQWAPRTAAGVAAAGGAPADLLRQLLNARAALRELHRKGSGAQQQGSAAAVAGGVAADGDEDLEQLLSEVLVLGKEAGVQQEPLADGLMQQLAGMKLGRGTGAGAGAGGQAAGFTGQGGSSQQFTAAAATAGAGGVRPEAASGPPAGGFSFGSSSADVGGSKAGAGSSGVGGPTAGSCTFGTGVDSGSNTAGGFSFPAAPVDTAPPAAAAAASNATVSGFRIGRSDGSATPSSVKAKSSGKGKTVRVKDIGRGTPVAPRAATATSAAFPGGLGAPHGAAPLGGGHSFGGGFVGTAAAHTAAAAVHAAAAGVSTSSSRQPSSRGDEQHHQQQAQQPQQQEAAAGLQFHPGVATGSGSGGAATPSRRKVVATRSPPQASRGTGAATAAAAGRSTAAAPQPAAHFTTGEADHMAGPSWQGFAVQPEELKHKQAAESTHAAAAAQQRDAMAAASSWRTKATNSYRVGKYKLAEQEYSRAIEALLQAQGPADELAPLYSNRGGARLMLQRPNAALKDALMSIQTSRKYVRGYLRAASCYAKLGDLAAAHQVLNRIADMTSASNPVWRELSQKVAEVEGKQAQLKALRKGVIGVEEVVQLEASGGMGLAGTGPLGEKEAGELLELAHALAEAMPYAEEVAALKAWLALRAGDLAAATQAATWSSTVVWDWHEAQQQQQHVQGQGAHGGMGAQQMALGVGWEWWVKAQVAYHQGSLEDAQRLLKEAVLGAKVHVPGAAAAGGGAPGGSANGSAAALGRWAKPLGALVPTQAAAEQLIEELLLLTGKKEVGNAALRGSKADDAVKAYTEALAAQGSSGFAAVLYCNRAAAQHSLKQYTEALADCGRALALKPDYVKANSRYGVEDWSRLDASDVLRWSSWSSTLEKVFGC